jgi:hypothetical protein
MRCRCGRICGSYRRRLTNNPCSVDCGEPPAGCVIGRGLSVAEKRPSLFAPRLFLLLPADIGVLQHYTAFLGLLFLVGQHRSTS